MTCGSLLAAYPLPPHKCGDLLLWGDNVVPIRYGAFVFLKTYSSFKCGCWISSRHFWLFLCMFRHDNRLFSKLRCHFFLIADVLLRGLGFLQYLSNFSSEFLSLGFFNSASVCCADVISKYDCFSKLCWSLKILRKNMVLKGLIVVLITVLWMFSCLFLIFLQVASFLQNMGWRFSLIRYFLKPLKDFVLQRGFCKSVIIYLRALQCFTGS